MTWDRIRLCHVSPTIFDTRGTDLVLFHTCWRTSYSAGTRAAYVQLSIAAKGSALRELVPELYVCVASEQAVKCMAHPAGFQPTIRKHVISAWQKLAERERKAWKRTRKLDENIRRTRVCSTCFKFHCCATPSLIKPNFAELCIRNFSFPDGINFRMFFGRHNSPLHH